jgi:hypothetical protein
MAEAPYNPIPSVTPQVNAPDDYQHIQASPNEFGGLIAAGGEKLGAGASTAAHFYQQVQTDHALNDTMAQGREAIEQFKTLNGADAMNAHQALQDNLEKIRQTGMDNLDSPAQKAQYDVQSRMFFERFLAPQIDNHANQQTRIYTKGVNDGIADNGHSMINAAPDDPNAFAFGAAKIHEGRMKEAQMEYGAKLPSEVFDRVEKQSAIEATQSRVLALVPTNPILAKQVFDANRDLMVNAPNYDTLSAHVESAADKALAGPIADKYLGNLGVTKTIEGGTTMAPRPVGPQQVAQLVDVLHGQESGGALGGVPTSPAGAVGPMQQKSGTFQQYTRPGEHLDINSLADQKIITGRIVEDGLRVSGGNPEGAAVAYFSGIGNVAPPGSPTPWKRDVVDPSNGLSVSQYVGQVSARAAKSGMLISKATTLDQIDKDYADNPALASAIRAHVNERFAVANQVQQSAMLAQENWRNTTAAGFASEVVKSTLPEAEPLGPDFYSRVAKAGDQGLSASTVEGLFKFGRSASQDALSQTAKDYGSGFLDVVRKMNLPADDPERISNDNQLISYLGENPDSLRPTGVSEASKFLKMAHEQPGQATMIEGFLKTGQDKILGQLKIPGMTDPVKDKKYSDWLNQALPQLYKGISEGKSIAELTKDGSPLAESMKAFAPTLADKINDKSKPPPSFTFEWGGRDLSTPAGILETRGAIATAYQKSAKTSMDWDKAMAALKSLPGKLQTPTSDR